MYIKKYNKIIQNLINLIMLVDSKFEIDKSYPENLSYRKMTNIKNLDEIISIQYFINLK